MSNPNYFLNVEVLARIGGNTIAYEADNARYDDGDEPCGICTICGEEIPISQLKPDMACIRCIMKE